MTELHQARDLATLQALVASGARARYIYFWGHTPKSKDAVGPWVLSQWFPAPFEVDQQQYPSAEHWMMAEKARLFGDEERRTRILEAKHPAEAKKHGRLVKGFDGTRWQQHRFEIVVTGNVHKFSQHEALSAYLRDTGEKVLVEASPRDRVWGIGLAADDPRAGDPHRWDGQNLLGFALMEARERLG